ncbi:MAG: hypothetical protein ACREJ3_06590 [Polyangiaceae bacterium]
MTTTDRRTQTIERAAWTPEHRKAAAAVKVGGDHDRAALDGQETEDRASEFGVSSPGPPGRAAMSAVT